MQSSETTTPQPIPVAVIGCGRMGRLHIRTYSQMPQVKLVGVFDANAQAAQAAATEYHCPAFTDLDELLSQVAAVTIAVPTQHHPAVAEQCLARRVACMIEKPLAKDVAEASRIVQWAKQHDAIVQVGHIERFNPVVRAMDRLGVRPQFIEVVRISPMTFRSTDVGVVLDMMIHDLDIVLRLAQSNVANVDAVGVSVIGQVEDICNARLTFENGCVANVTASRLAMKTERKLRIFSREAYLSLDYQKRQGAIVRRSGNLEALRSAADRIRRGEVPDPSQVNYAGLVQIEPLEIDNADPLRSEQESFIDAVRHHRRPEVSAEDGLAAVELAERIVAAIGAQTL